MSTPPLYHQLQTQLSQWITPKDSRNTPLNWGKVMGEQVPLTARFEAGLIFLPEKNENREDVMVCTSDEPD
jgi:hypothetical protein